MPSSKSWSRRGFLGLGVAGGASLVWAARRRVRDRIANLTLKPAFSATPALVSHDPVRDARRLHVSRGLGPAGNVEAAIASLGGMEQVVGKNDVVLIKVSAQWWNQGMTNVAAVKRAIELVLAVPGFSGEVIVFENTHFIGKDGSPLTRGFSHPSVRNVDVPGWDKLGDLFPHFAKLDAPVSYVGLVDAMKSANGAWGWRDPSHAHGEYGGDGRGPITAGELRDGYRWDFDKTFRIPRSLVDDAQTPLTWPVFTSPHSGLTIDFRDGLFMRRGGKVEPVSRKLTWITMPTVNEHLDAGLTCCCKSAMGIVDMSAGRPGTHPSTRDYQSIHYFGHPNATWRMAGPLAYFAREVRAPDLYLAVAEYVGAIPRGSWNEDADLRLEAASAHRVGVVVAGQDPVAIDSWCARNLLAPLKGGAPGRYDLDNPDSMLSCFLRYYREVYGSGTLDPKLITVA